MKTAHAITFFWRTPARAWSYLNSYLYINDCCKIHSVSRNIQIPENVFEHLFHICITYECAFQVLRVDLKSLLICYGYLNPATQQPDNPTTKQPNNPTNEQPITLLCLILHIKSGSNNYRKVLQGYHLTLVFQ